MKLLVEIQINWMREVTKELLAFAFVDDRKVEIRESCCPQLMQIVSFGEALFDLKMDMVGAIG